MVPVGEHIMQVNMVCALSSLCPPAAKMHCRVNAAMSEQQLNAAAENVAA